MKNYILYQGNPVYFQSKGKGKVLVLLHGFTESGKIWKIFNKELAKEFNVITIDLPGHGKTGVFSNTHTMEFMADTVDAVLSGLHVNKCVMIGHSMGGYVTLAYVNKYRKKIQGYGLFHSQAAADSEEAKVNRQRTIEAVEANRTEFIMNFIPDLFAPDNVKQFQQEIKALQEQALIPAAEGITAALRGMMVREDNQSLLAEVDKPLLVIAGKQDTRIPVDMVLQQVAPAKHAEILVLGNTGHMGFIEAREETLGFMRDFSRRCFL